MNITNLYIKFCEHIVCSIEISNRTHGISLLDQTNPELTKMKKNKPKTK
jgi:tRNA(Ser,Leu) C12 N-acetylase TAN1